MKLIAFTATWCGPCKLFKPQLKQLPNTIEIIEYDVDDNKQLAAEMGVKSVPAAFLMDNDKVLHKFEGFVPASHLLERIKQYEN